MIYYTKSNIFTIKVLVFISEINSVLHRKKKKKKKEIFCFFYAFILDAIQFFILSKLSLFWLDKSYFFSICSIFASNNT